MTNYGLLKYHNNINVVQDMGPSDDPRKWNNLILFPKINENINMSQVFATNLMCYNCGPNYHVGVLGRGWGKSSCGVIKVCWLVGGMSFQQRCVTKHQKNVEKGSISRFYNVILSVMHKKTHLKKLDFLPQLQYRIG